MTSLMGSLTRISKFVEVIIRRVSSPRFPDKYQIHRLMRLQAFGPENWQSSIQTRQLTARVSVRLSFRCTPFGP